MATDYATSPVTDRAVRSSTALAAACITILIRYFGSYAEGVSYAILIMNACVGPAAGQDTACPKRFGHVRHEKEACEMSKTESSSADYYLQLALTLLLITAVSCRPAGALVNYVTAGHHCGQHMRDKDGAGLHAGGPPAEGAEL